MPTQSTVRCNATDALVLRELAARRLEIAHDPVNTERRRLWYLHDMCRGERPMVLVESWPSFELMPDSQLRCEAPWARDLERSMRFEIFRFERIHDDQVVEPWVSCNWKLEISDYGARSETTYAERVSGNISSRHCIPPITDFAKDIHKLKDRTYSVDREASLAWRAMLAEVFDGICPVEIRGGFWWTTGMTQLLLDMIGMENMFTWMCTQPESIHHIMAFFRDDHIALTDWLEAEGLFTLNNRNDYIGSGSMGYTHALPQPDLPEGSPPRAQDLWVLSESQETSNVSPMMFEEFVFRYQLPVVERFGCLYYGCCEPLEQKWDIIQRFPNLKRVSVSPWCDEAFMADALGRNYVYSRKPNPTLVSTPFFDEDAIRADILRTLDIARDCELEFVLKDVHTVCNQPQRLARWTELTREVIEGSR